MNSTYDFYITRARESAAEAKVATLDNVRDRALRSEATWRGLAEQARGIAQQREKIAREKEAAGRTAQEG